MREFKFLKYIISTIIFVIISIVSTNILAEDHIAYDSDRNFVWSYDGRVKYEITWVGEGDEICVHINKGELAGRAFCSKQGGELTDDFKSAYNAKVPRSGEITLTATATMDDIIESGWQYASGEGSDYDEDEAIEEAENDAKSNALSKAGEKLDTIAATTQSNLNKGEGFDSAIEKINKTIADRVSELEGNNLVYPDKKQPYKSLEILFPGKTRRTNTESRTPATFAGKPTGSAVNGWPSSRVGRNGWPTWGEKKQTFNGFQEGVTYGLWGEYLDNDKLNNSKYRWTEMQRAVREFTEWMYGEAYLSSDERNEETENKIKLKETVKTYYSFYLESINGLEEKERLNVAGQNNTAQVKVGNEETDYYMVGPFYLKYDQKEYDDLLFSWIESVEIDTQIWKTKGDSIPTVNTNLVITDMNLDSEIQITNEKGEPLKTKKMSTPVYDDNKGINNIKTQEGGEITEINAPSGDEEGHEFYLKYTGSYVNNKECNFVNFSDISINIKFKFKYINGYEDGYDEDTGEYYTDATEYNTRQHTWVWEWDDKNINDGLTNGIKYEAKVGSITESDAEVIGAGTGSASADDNAEPSPTPTPTPYHKTRAAKAYKNGTVSVTGTKYGKLVCTQENDGITQTFITNVRGRLKYGELEFEIPFRTIPTPSTSTPTGTPSTPTGTPSTPTGTPSTPTGTPSTPTGTPSTPTGTPSTPTGTPPPPPPPTAEIEIAGTIWKDAPGGKDSKLNGEVDNDENKLNGIEVWLYELTKTVPTDSTRSEYYKTSDGNNLQTSDGYYLKLATFNDYSNGNTNPQLTKKSYNSDTKAVEDGRYSFKHLDPFTKYMVVYKYDGMLYENTYNETPGEQPEYNTDAWIKASKGSELVNERDSLNRRFTTIESMGSSYKVSKKIFDDNTYLSKHNSVYYNEMYNIRSQEVIHFKELIRERIDEYITTNKRLKENDYITQIYNPIVTSQEDQTRARRILQFLYDCRTSAYAGYSLSVQGGRTEIGKLSDCAYPHYNKYIVYENPDAVISGGSTLVLVSTIDLTRATATREKQVNGYYYIYRGQLYVNLGLVERPSTELKVDEYLNKVVVSINGKDEIYKYYSDDEPLVDIRRDDITQNIAYEDYNYATTSAQLASALSNNLAHYEEDYAKIELYATYIINVKNDSNVKTSVNELVTYFDRHFLSFSKDYKTTEGNEIKGVTAKFYDASVTNLSDINVDVRKDSKCPGSDIYVENRDLGMTDRIDLYLGFDNILLNNGEGIRLYITYRLGENSTFDSKYNCTYSNGGNSAQNILQKEIGDNPNKKITIAPFVEVNSYSTYIEKYKDSNSNENNVRARYNGKYSYILNGGEYRAAGYLDTYSIPGNLNNAIITKNKDGKNDTWKIVNGYETGSITPNLEYDWARSESFVLQTPNSDSRRITGNVWETNEDASYYIGETNGMYPKYTGSEAGANGITVELIEINNKDFNGNRTETKIYEHVRAVTKTNNGKYEFKGFIPGDYVVRFTYGDKAEYNTTQYSNKRTYSIGDQEYKYAYNGEFYQSAKANPNTDLEQYWYDKDKEIRYSDAYDEANIRMYVNSLFNNNSKNGYVYGDTANVTKRPTDYMVYAYTSPLEIEVEYATKERAKELGSNPEYEISNIDFALTPRTETNLEIFKEVSNVKLILQDGTVQFEATPETIREQGVPAVAQVVRGSNIFIQMPDSTINGATIEVTYKITVTNKSNYDSVTYYKNDSNEVVAIGLYEEKPENIVYYENEQMRTYHNEEKVALKDIEKPSYDLVENKTCTYTSKIKAGTTEVVPFNSRKTEKVETTTTPSVVADYISNNATFSKTNYVGATINSYWTKASDEKDAMVEKYYNVYMKDKNLDPTSFKDLDKTEVYNHNEIVYATEDNPLIKNKLKSGQSSTAEIVISKVLSTENNLQDTKEYSNYIRVLGINNTVSRIQDITKISCKTESVIIGKPTGTTENTNYTLIVLILIGMTIIATGVILIKKFVIRKS